MRLSSLILSLAPVFAVVACSPQQPAEDTTYTDTTAADAEAVRTHVDQFVSAWNTADDAALSSMVAEDAVLLQPDGPVLEGREAILGVMRVQYEPATMQQSATVDEVTMVGDYAYGRGTWNIDPTSEAGPDVPAASGKWSVIYQRGADGSWQVWRWMWNQPSPVAPAVE